MFKRTSLLAASVIILSGCGGTPTCSDTETIDLVLELSNDELVSQFGEAFASQIEMEVDTIRTKSHDTDVDTYECAADLVMSGPGGSESVPFEYTVESTDDSDEFYVTVYGL